MQPVPSRVVQSYHVRYSLGSIFDDPEPRVPRNVADAIDLHVHAQTGTEDPLEIAKAATRAGMGAVVFKNLPGRGPRAEVAHQVSEDLKRWAEAENLSPITCLHGAQTDPMYGGLNAESVRKGSTTARASSGSRSSVALTASIGLARRGGP
jgi:hypothetical protein